MNEVTEKKTTYDIAGLGILAILAFAILFVPIKTEAGINYIFSTPVGVNNNFISVPSGQPIYLPPVQTYYPINTQTVSTIPTIDSTKKIAKNTTSIKTNQEEDKYKNLAASAIFGNIGFVPSGLFQWILFAILILLIIILTRRIFGGNKKYQETPLKKP